MIPQSTTIEEYLARLQRHIQHIEAHREAIAAGDVVLEDDGTLWTREAWERLKREPRSRHSERHRQVLEGLGHG